MVVSIFFNVVYGKRIFFLWYIKIIDRSVYIFVVCVVLDVSVWRIVGVG